MTHSAGCPLLSKTEACLRRWSIGTARIFRPLEEYIASPKTNLLKEIRDMSGRTVTYEYDDGDGNLTSVNNNGRITKYTYYLRGDYPTLNTPTSSSNSLTEYDYRAELHHNLKAVAKPREVAANPDTSASLQENHVWLRPGSPKL